MAEEQHVDTSAEEVAESLRLAAVAEQVPVAKAQPDASGGPNGGTNTPDASLVPKAGMKVPPPLKIDQKSLHHVLRCKTTGVWINNDEGKVFFLLKDMKMFQTQWWSLYLLTMSYKTCATNLVYTCYFNTG